MAGKKKQVKKKQVKKEQPIKEVITSKIESEPKMVKPIKEVITSKTEVKVEEPRLLKLKDNKDLEVLKKYQKELELQGFELSDGRVM